MNLKSLIGLCIYKIAPIRRNRFVFTSFNGHYSDSTKAISIKLHEMSPKSEIVWLVDKERENDIPEYAKAVNINSLKSYWYRGTATAQIDNIYGFRAYFRADNRLSSRIKMSVWSFLTSKKKQPIFATTHGTALKKVGRDQVGNTVLDMVCSNTYLLVGDQFTAEILRKVTFEKIPTSALGFPRNDALFLENSKSKALLGVPEDKKIILFAPTFRNDGKDVEGKNIFRSGLNQLSEMNFDRLFETLNQKFGGDWVMVCRFHYHVANMVDWKSLDDKYPNKFINGNLHDDMADYLVCADVLLTDSSSCMFDFCLTKKPCFIYFPDLEHYRDKERGFYMDINGLPFSVAVDFRTLIDNIENFNQLEYSVAVDKLLEHIGTMSDGNAAQRVVQFIFDKCKSR